MSQKEQQQSSNASTKEERNQLYVRFKKALMQYNAAKSAAPSENHQKLKEKTEYAKSLFVQADMCMPETERIWKYPK